MKLLLTFTLIFSQIVYAQNGAGLLLQKNKDEIDLTSRLVQQKMYKLDNAFKVQLFASWKILRVLDENANKWVELVLEDKYQAALVNYPVIFKHSDVKFKKLMNGTLAYLQWKLKLSHAFLEHWTELAANQQIIRSELGIALDQVVGKKASSWILKNGLVFTKEQNQRLSKIENEESLINFALQAWKNQRQGEKSIKWVNKLELNNPLRIKLIYTAITDFANKGKLGLSGQLIKKAIEPYIETSESESDISYYYLTLGRLLYQAKAYEASEEYYSYIPVTSEYFLQAQVESSWSAIQRNDMSKAKGQLASLNLELFNDKFIPDVYLTNAIVNLKTCQFQEVQKSLNKFVEVNSIWAKKIEENLKSSEPVLTQKSVYTEAIRKHKLSLRAESQLLKNIFTNKIVNSDVSLKVFSDKLKANYQKSSLWVKMKEYEENIAMWKNKSKMLEDAIYRMKFVRIEFLSQMRNFALNIPLRNTDEVSTYSSAPRRHNQLVFPNDGNVWGDDLFRMTAQVENLCMKGRKK